MRRPPTTPLLVCCGVLVAVWLWRMHHASFHQISSFYLSASRSERNNATINNPGTSSSHDDDQGLPYCNRSQIRNGMWVERPQNTSFKGGTAPHLKRILAPRSKFCQEKALFRDPQSDYYLDPYQWKLVGNNNNKACCEFEDEFDAVSFCETMKHSVILFIGDSTSYEQYGSLVNLLGGNTSELLKHRSLLKNLSLVQNVCSDGGDVITLVFRWSYFLEDIDRFLKETFPTLVVANTGAHFYKIEHPISKRMEEVIGHVASWQQDCHQKNLPCLFLYRTAPPGHADCKDWTKPENNLSIMEELVATRGTTGRENYHWEDFKLLNDKVLETIDRHANNSTTRSGTIHVLDGYDLAIRRPDNHLGPHNGDCLHTCSPGVSDTYNIVMAHQLRGIWSQEDTRRVASKSYEWNRTSNVRPDGSDVIWTDPAPYLNGDLSSLTNM